VAGQPGLVEVPLRPGHRWPRDRNGTGREWASREDEEGRPRGTGLRGASIDRFLEAFAQGAIFDEEPSMKKKKASKPEQPLKQTEQGVVPLASPPSPPPLLLSDPEATMKRNQKWFSTLNETVGTIAVVPPPLAGPPITVIPGFTVPCICKANPMYSPPQLRPPCEKCGGKGFVVVEKG
jgi:hypothetical protein